MPVWWDKYRKSIISENLGQLLKLRGDMQNYYSNLQYHDEWICGHNANWKSRTHAAQIAACRRIRAGANVLEVGCGRGDAYSEITKLVGTLLTLV